VKNKSRTEKAGRPGGHGAAQTGAPQFPSLRAWLNAQPRTQRQEDLASSLGITGPSFSQYLNGRRRPSLATARMLSQKTGVPVESILYPDAQAVAS